MEKKHRADWVFFNVQFLNRDDEAIAIHHGKVIAIGSIPYIFSNYRGFIDMNAQGNPIINEHFPFIEVGQNSDGITIYTEHPEEQFTIWQMEGPNCISKNLDLLDPDWDDH